MRPVRAWRSAAGSASRAAMRSLRRALRNAAIRASGGGKGGHCAILRRQSGWNVAETGSNEE
jgi:hypothetical protein